MEEEERITPTSPNTMIWEQMTYNISVICSAKDPEYQWFWYLLTNFRHDQLEKTIREALYLLLFLVSEIFGWENDYTATKLNLQSIAHEKISPVNYFPQKFPQKSHLKSITHKIFPCSPLHSIHYHPRHLRIAESLLAMSKYAQVTLATPEIAKINFDIQNTQKIRKPKKMTDKFMTKPGMNKNMRLTTIYSTSEQF